MLVAVAVLFGLGCSGKIENTSSQEAPSSEATGTLTWIEKDPIKGVIRGTYSLDQHEIKFEVLRGEETPESAKKIYPGVASHAIDIRVCDAQNFCFINGAGGHALQESTWISPDQNREPTSEEAAKNFQAVWALHQTLKQEPTETYAGLEEEISALDFATNQPPETTNGIPPEYDPLHRYTPSSYKGTPSKSVLSLSVQAAGMNDYTQILQIWRQNLVKPFAYHSATYARAYITSTGQAVSYYYTCNHGACGADISKQMLLYCSRNFAGRASSSLPMNARCSDPAKIGTYHSPSLNCCQSFYSYGPLDLSHVCNDDSALQRDLMIVGIGPVNAPYCSDRYLQGQAPYCG